jgi:hypothetical protein
MTIYQQNIIDSRHYVHRKDELVLEREIFEKKQILVYYIDHHFYIHKSLEGFLASTIYW